MPTNPKIEIITHYAKDDPDCGSDYYSVDVKIGGKIVRHYSDHYHDKGREKSEAFADGVLFAAGVDTKFGENLAQHGITFIEKADDKT